MPSPSLLTLSQRLTSTSSLLLERSRILTLNLPPSASSQTQIVRNLTLIKGDLDTLEADLARAHEAAGGPARKKGKEGEVERQVREMGESYDRLVEMFAEDPVGRDKAKGLRRERQANKPASPESNTTSPFDDPAPAPSSASGSIPRVSIEPPTPAVSGHPHAPFKDYPDDVPEGEEDGRTDHEMLSQQQVLMDDQDERLNLLSHSIGRQNHLSIQIGDELDQHHELLEETDAAMDRTAARLNSARRRLNRVADDAKQHGSTITIVVLIFILLILIIVFKT